MGRLDAESETLLPCVAPTIEAVDGRKWGSNQWVNNGKAIVSIQDVTPREKAQNGKGWNDDGTAYTVDTHATQDVAQPAIGFQDDTTPKAREEGAYCLRQDAGGQGACVMTPALVVRRLTPVECERLQGFPDNYTNIKDKCPDGPRYKALGNSWAVPVVRWIGERINAMA
jgi:DNA (cytosine-5)-methyltransferase 1